MYRQLAHRHRRWRGRYHLWRDRIAEESGPIRLRPDIMLGLSSESSQSLIKERCVPEPVPVGRVHVPPNTFADLPTWLSPLKMPLKFLMRIFVVPLQLFLDKDWGHWPRLLPTLIFQKKLVAAVLIVIFVVHASFAGLPIVIGDNTLSLKDHAVQLAHDGKLKESLSTIQQAYEENQNDAGTVADYIVILSWNEEYKLAAALYEQKASLNLPDYVLPEVARAYREIGNGRQARILYEMYTTNHPDDVNAQIGTFWTALEAGNLKEAHQQMDMLLVNNPANADYHLRKADIYINEDQLSKAQKYLEGILDSVDDPVKIKTTLSQIYLWRGWARRALREFEALRAQDAAAVLISNGYANALNNNARKKEAREYIQSMISQYPQTAHFSRTKHSFDIEDMMSFATRNYYTKEFSGEDEVYLSGRFDQPLGHQHIFYTEYIRRLITSQPKDDVAKRVYIGDQWQPNNMWRLTGAISADAENGKAASGLGRVSLTPDDFWTFSFGYDSRAIDVPLRSRTVGTKASDYSWSAAYRASEALNTTVGVNRRDYSDDNESLGYFWYTDTALKTTAKWKVRLGTDFYMATNSNQDVAYFSPKRSYSFYVVPMLERVWFRRPQKAFVNRVYVGLGQIWQSHFNSENAGFVRYEQDHKISDTVGLVVGTTYSLNSYDGKDSNRLNVTAALRFKF